MDKREANTLCDKYYREYKDYITNYCKSRLSGRPGDVEDCVQETFRALLEELEKTGEVKYPRAFLYKCASNFINCKFRDLERSRKHNVSLDGEAPRLSYVMNFFGEAPNDEKLRALRKVLATLTEKERELLYYNCRPEDGDYLTVKELAEKYACSENTIYQRGFELRSKVKKLMLKEMKANNAGGEKNDR